MASDENPYTLTEEDTAWDSGDDCPEIRTARNPDSRILSAVLKRPRRPTRHPSGVPPNPANTFDRTSKTLQTPLIVAIRTQLPDNVRVLLDLGVDANGYSLSVLADYAKAFLRFRNHHGSTEVFNPLQAIPITAEEIETRDKQILCSFWLSPGSCHRQFYHGGDGITALEEACKHNSAQTVEMILSVSPDISFRTNVEQEIPEWMGTTP